VSLWHAVPLDVNAGFRSVVSSSGGSLLWSPLVATTAALLLVWLQSAALASLSRKNGITNSRYVWNSSCFMPYTFTTWFRGSLKKITCSVQCGHKSP
jgi:hypothetical protein